MSNDELLAATHRYHTMASLTRQLPAAAWYRIGGRLAAAARMMQLTGQYATFVADRVADCKRRGDEARA